MSVPQKPWQNMGTQLPRSHFSGSSELGIASGRNVLNSNAPQRSRPVGSVRSTVIPPPLPPRPPQLSMAVPTCGSRPTCGMGPNMFGGYSNYSPYGGYSSYGNYPGSMYYPSAFGYGSYNQPGNVFENRFLQMAEESSRGTFQSIESLVRAFTSVSMMLESTYQAMYSSFRAILGVVDNFSRLRQMFAQLISAITILRIIRNFYHRLLYWLGIIGHNPQSDRIWEAASGEGVGSHTPHYSSWPLFTFVGLLFGGPYLISKLFTPSSLESPKKWDHTKGTYRTTTYPHEAASLRELSFKENELLNIAPAEFQLKDCNGWLLAENRNGDVGYVPATRLSAPIKQETF